MRIAITGATGYIGQRLIHAARLAGHEVLALSRRPVIEAGVAWQFFELANATPLALPSDIDAVLHLAAETRNAAGLDLTEQKAAQLLIDAAASVRAAFVFMSSQTACADAPTAYGRIKWKIERATIEAGGLVIRPGQVYGGPEHGLFGVLCTVVRNLPVLPAFVPAPAVQPVHVDDLVVALLACLAREPSSIISVAAPEGISLTAFLRAIARGRTSRCPVFIPVPVLLLRVTARLLGSGLSRKLGLERLLSLFALQHMNTAGDLQHLALMLRPLSSGMPRSGRGRRELIREGRVLLTYVLRTKPAGALVQRYARAVETLRINQPLQLPELVLKAPALLALLDGSRNIDTNFRCELDWRINAAVMLAEASPQGASRFLDIDNTGSCFRGTVLIVRACMMELSRRFIRFLLWPVLSRVGRKGVYW
ncbi:MAG: hypothetical protein DDT27_00522 [Dehalococcoidia bacterium]|nr:hypothetical protein [Chloroflexota bacterium]MBT9161979.1 hypothetical protein [Chloroflexota bacterium]